MKTNELKKYIENMMDKPDSDETIAGYMKSNDVPCVDLIAVIRMLMKKPAPKAVRSAAEQIEEAAENWEKNGKKHFSKDPMMIAAYMKDKADLMMVAALLRKEEYEKAQIKAGNLDTILRDAIPNDAWDFIQSFA